MEPVWTEKDIITGTRYAFEDATTHMIGFLSGHVDTFVFICLEDGAVSRPYSRLRMARKLNAEGSYPLGSASE